jgi:hypothetical protein
MFKVKYSAQDDFALTAEVTEAGRGKWRKIGNPSAYNPMVFRGFDGEATVTVIDSGMQDGRIDMVLVFTLVDNPSQVIQKQLPRPAKKTDQFDIDRDAERMTEWINSTLAIIESQIG